MAIRQELLLDTNQARRQASELERILDQAVRDLKVTFDRSAIDGLQRQLSALKVDLDAEQAVRLRDGLQKAAGAGRDLNTGLARIETNLKDSAGSADLLEKNLAEAKGELREGAQLALRLDDKLDDAAVAARRTAQSLGTVSAAGLTPAVAQAGDLSGALLAATGAAATLGRQSIVSPQSASAAEGLSESMARLRATAITSPDIARTLGLGAVATSGTAAAAGLGASLKALLPIAGAAAVAGLAFRAVSGEIRAATAASSALAESASKFGVVFGQDAAKVEASLGDTTKTVLLSRQAALESAATFGNLFQALGTSRQEAGRLSPVVVQLAADLASFNNLNLDDALIAIRAGLVGEVEPLRRLGVSFNAAQVEAKALELGLADANGEVSEGAKVQARLALILAQTTAAQGDVTRTAEGYANTQRRVRAETEDLRAEIGDHLLPGQQALLKVQEDLIPALRDFGTAAADAFSSLVSSLAPVIVGLGQLIGLADNVSRGVAVIGEAIQQAFSFDREERAINRLQSATLAALESIDRTLEKGGDASTAFANGLFHVATVGVVTADVVKKLGAEAGLTDDQIRAATINLINLALAAGAPVDEIENLRAGLAEMNRELLATGAGGLARPGRHPVAQVASDALKFTDALISASAESRRFNKDLQTLADRGFASLADRLRELGGPEGATLAAQFASNLTLAGTAEDFLRPALDIPAVLDQIAADAEARGQRLRDAIDPFKGAAAQVQISIKEFTRNVRQQIEQEAELEAGTALLRALGLDKLADKIQTQGTPALTVMRSFLKDLTAASDVEATLETQSTANVEAIARGLKTNLQALGVDPELARLIVATIDNPTVRAGFAEGAGVLGDEARNALLAALKGDRQRIEPDFVIDLHDPAADARRQVAEELSRDKLAADIHIDLHDEGTEARRTMFEGLNDQRIRADFDIDRSNIRLDLTDEGRQARSSFFQGLSTAASGETGRLRDSIVQTVNGAIQRQSPPKLFMDIGRESGVAFMEGVRDGIGSLRDSIEVDLSNLDVKGTGFKGRPTTTGPAANVNLTVVGTGDPSRAATRAAVHAQQVSSLLGIVRR